MNSIQEDAISYEQASDIAACTNIGLMREVLQILRNVDRH